MAAKVLVTGGSGFIGGWCIVKLLERGDTVRTTVRAATREASVRKAVTSTGTSAAGLSFAIADLTSDTGWDAAMDGIDYVLHVASPLGTEGEGADLLVPAAREGTLRVLRAAVRAGVKRVVFTSSCAAATPLVTGADTISDETTWSDEQDLARVPYRLSKLLAERAAWDFMRTEGGKTGFVTILPSAVLGPVLSREGLGSVQVVQRLVEGRLPLVPRMGLNVVDVRDVADLHVRAMEHPAAAGERFIASGEFMWMLDVAHTLRARLGPRGAKVPTRPMPDLLVKLLALVLPPLRVIRPLLGRAHRFSYTKAARVLGYAPRPAAEVVVDCANSLLPA